jgi:hypothetical protein
MALAPALRERGGGVPSEARTFQAIALDVKGLDSEALVCLEQTAVLRPFATWPLKNPAILILIGVGSTSPSRLSGRPFARLRRIYGRGSCWSRR